MAGFWDGLMGMLGVPSAEAAQRRQRSIEAFNADKIRQAQADREWNASPIGLALANGTFQDRHLYRPPEPVLAPPAVQQPPAPPPVEEVRGAPSVRRTGLRSYAQNPITMTLGVRG